MEIDVVPQSGELSRGHYNPHRELKAPSPLDKHEVKSGLVKFRAKISITIPNRRRRAI
jgi:hypothetical protein